MTPACNLPEGFSLNAAVLIEASVASIAEGLQTLFAMSDSERESMGASGLALAKKRFTWPQIAADIRSVYAWMLGAGPKPSCVVE